LEFSEQDFSGKTGLEETQDWRKGFHEPQLAEFEKKEKQN